jgi:hypothetical protein
MKRRFIFAGYRSHRVLDGVSHRVRVVPQIANTARNPGCRAWQCEPMTEPQATMLGVATLVAAFALCIALFAALGVIAIYLMRPDIAIAVAFDRLEDDAHRHFAVPARLARSS